MNRNLLTALALFSLALLIGCRSIQTWDKCPHNQPIIEIRLDWGAGQPQETHILRLEDAIRNASLRIEDSYLSGREQTAGECFFTTHPQSGHHVVSYYCQEIETDHRLALEFVRTTRGLAVERAIYFLYAHDVPAPAWDGEYSPPRLLLHFDRPQMPNLTLDLRDKSLHDSEDAARKALRMTITLPREAVPLWIYDSKP